MNKPNFELINKYTVQITSLKNQLRLSTDIDELTIIADRIIELENQIIAEKASGVKILEKEKKNTLERIDKIHRELRKAEEELQRIDQTMEFRLTKYKETLESKIESLSKQYNEQTK